MLNEYEEESEVMPDYAIQIQNLTYTFGEVQTVDDLTLDVPCGIVLGFLGPRGSDKTTTNRMRKCKIVCVSR